MLSRAAGMLFRFLFTCALFAGVVSSGERPGEGVCVAIVAMDDAGWKVADLVTAQLADNDNVILLDREVVRTLVREKRLALEGLTGRSVVGLATVLHTNLFVMVGREAASVVVFDAGSGVKIIDADFPQGKIDEQADFLTKSINTAVYPFLHPKDSVYFGLLRERNAGLPEKYNETLREFGRLFLRALMNTEGITVVERSQLAALTKERQLTFQSTDMKASSYLLYLEAAPAPDGEGQIITVFVLDLQDKKRHSFVVKNPFDKNKQKESINKASVGLLAASRMLSLSGAENKQNKAEAKVYFKQYEDLYKQKKYAQALPKIEAVAALDECNPFYHTEAAMCELIARKQDSKTDLVEAGMDCLQRLKRIEADFPEYVRGLYKENKTFYVRMFYASGVDIGDPFYSLCERYIRDTLLPQEDPGVVARIGSFKKDFYAKTIAEQKEIFKIKYGFDPEGEFEKLQEVVQGDVFKRSRIQLIENFYQYRADNFMECCADKSGLKRLQQADRYNDRIYAYFSQHPDEAKKLSFKNQMACCRFFRRVNMNWQSWRGSEDLHQAYLKLSRETTARLRKSPVFFVRFIGHCRQISIDVHEGKYDDRSGVVEIRKFYQKLYELVERFDLAAGFKKYSNDIFLVNLLNNSPFGYKKVFKDEYRKCGLKLLEFTRCPATGFWRSSVDAERDPVKQAKLYKRFKDYLPAKEEVLPGDLWGQFFKRHEAWEAKLLASLKTKLGEQQYRQLTGDAENQHAVKIEKVLDWDQIPLGINWHMKDVPYYRTIVIDNRLYVLLAANNFWLLCEYRDGQMYEVARFKGTLCEVAGREYDLLLGLQKNYFAIAFEGFKNKQIALYRIDEPVEPVAVIEDLPQGIIKSLLIHEGRVFVSICCDREFYIASWNLSGGDMKIHISNTRREKRTALDKLEGKKLDNVVISGLCAGGKGKILFTLFGNYFPPTGIYEFDYVSSKLSRPLWLTNSRYGGAVSNLQNSTNSACYDGFYYMHSSNFMTSMDVESKKPYYLAYNLIQSKNKSGTSQWIGYRVARKINRWGQPLLPQYVTYTLDRQFSWPFVFRGGCVWQSAVRRNDLPKMMDLSWPDNRETFRQLKKPVIFSPDPDNKGSVLAFSKEGLFRMTAPEYPELDFPESEKPFKDFWEKCFKQKLTRQKLRALRSLKLLPGYAPTDEQMAWLFKHSIGICEIWLKGECYSDLSWTYDNLEPLMKLTLNGTKLPEKFIKKIRGESVAVEVLE